MQEIIACSWAVVRAVAALLVIMSSLLFEEAVNTFYRKGEVLNFAQHS